MDSVKLFRPTTNITAANGNEFRQAIMESLESGDRLLLIDLAEVTLIDSAGLGVLVGAFRQARDLQARLYLCGVNPQVKIILEIAGLDEIFEIFASQEEFYTACAENQLINDSV